MIETQTIHSEERLSLEAEILRHLWYEGHATPVVLSSTLHRSLPFLHDCLDDLMRRRCIYQFFSSPQGRDASIYCLTRRAQQVLQEALKGYSRYKLKSFWDALKREQRLWDTYLGP
jgi:hypothetical protein